jgi:hypothetical protein
MKKFNVCIFSPVKEGKLPVFDEVAMSVFYGLQALGYDTVMRDDYLHKDRVNIVFGANQYNPAWHPSLEDQAIVIYNLEQITNGSKDKTVVNDGYKQLLARYPVLDYDSRNLAILTSWQVRARQHPIAHAPELVRVVPLMGEMPAPEYDVGFVGSLGASTPRRTQMLDALRAAGLKVRPIVGAYGLERDRAFRQCKMMINIAFYDNALLEMARLGYLFTNGIPVVSEISAHAQIDPALRAALQPVPYEQLVARCVELANDSAKRAALADACTAYYTAPARSASAVMQATITWLNTLAEFKGDWAIETDPAKLTPRSQSAAERSQVAYWGVPHTLNIGSGREYNPAWVNADIAWQWQPDWLVDLAKPLDFDGIDTAFGAHGRHRMVSGMFHAIKASEVLEHVSDAVVFMKNCLDLLCDGGTLTVTVPYDLSYGAWQDPTHVRGFNERSFWYYCEWHWYLGWMTHRFDTTMLTYSLSAYGHELINQNGMTLEEAARIPRAVDHIVVTLVKRALTADEIQYARASQLCNR